MDSKALLKPDCRSPDAPLTDIIRYVTVSRISKDRFRVRSKEFEAASEDLLSHLTQDYHLPSVTDKRHRTIQANARYDIMHPSYWDHKEISPLFADIAQKKAILLGPFGYDALTTSLYSVSKLQYHFADQEVSVYLGIRESERKLARYCDSLSDMSWESLRPSWKPICGCAEGSHRREMQKMDGKHCLITRADLYIFVRVSEATSRLPFEADGPGIPQPGPRSSSGSGTK